MDNVININLIGNPTDEFKSVEASLREKNHFKLHLFNYLADFVSDDKFLDARAVTILCLEDDWKDVLHSAREHKNLTNGNMLVIGPENTQAMRAAMRLGVHDYFSLPVENEELIHAIDEVADILSSVENVQQFSQVTTIINTAGGSGGSFISTNLAHILATENKQQVALLDMDVQFGSQALNLDLTCQYGITDVLASTSKLDSIALPAYFAKHKSGVLVMGEKLEDIVIPSEIPAENVEKFIDLCHRTFPHTVIDLPRQIDSLFAAVVAKSQRIVLVMQQTLAHVRDTKRLLTILSQEFEISKDNINVIVNRFDEGHAISQSDIDNTIGHKVDLTLPNDYARAVKATELAQPFVESAPTSPLAKGLIELASKISGRELTMSSDKSSIKKTLGGLFGSKKR